MFKASDYYDIMAAECKLTIVATRCRTRPSMAKVRVEIDLLKPQADVVYVGLVHDNAPQTGFMQKIEYEGVPKYCKHWERNWCYNGESHRPVVRGSVGTNREEAGQNESALPIDINSENEAQRSSTDTMRIISKNKEQLPVRKNEKGNQKQGNQCYEDRIVEKSESITTAVKNMPGLDLVVDLNIQNSQIQATSEHNGTDRSENKLTS
ncbi:hypothetical protein HAX54_038536 [Datura stramonium]|uniref:Uncharacterized protein n=1 Tax=Datura stramonium TaxID=4076 RepID=A0ABS8VJX9_DATST|nr:hypothetical protein [Datura stramonium]